MDGSHQDESQGCGVGGSGSPVLTGFLLMAAPVSDLTRGRWGIGDPLTYWGGSDAKEGALISWT